MAVPALATSLDGKFTCAMSAISFLVNQSYPIILLICIPRFHSVPLISDYTTAEGGEGGGRTSLHAPSNLMM